jgi:hypothetical protein
MTARLTGAGVVVEQHPAPGAPIPLGAICEIRLARRQPPIPGVTP